MQEKKKYNYHHTRTRIIKAIEKELITKCRNDYKEKSVVKKEREYSCLTTVDNITVDNVRVIMNIEQLALKEDEEVVFGEITLDIIGKTTKEENRKIFLKIMRIIFNKMEYDGFYEVISREYTTEITNYKGTSTMGGLYAYEWVFSSDGSTIIKFGGKIK